MLLHDPSHHKKQQCCLVGLSVGDARPHPKTPPQSTWHSAPKTTTLVHVYLLLDLTFLWLVVFVLDVYAVCCYARERKSERDNNMISHHHPSSIILSLDGCWVVMNAPNDPKRHWSNWNNNTIQTPPNHQNCVRHVWCVFLYNGSSSPHQTFRVHSSISSVSYSWCPHNLSSEKKYSCGQWKRHWWTKLAIQSDWLMGWLVAAVTRRNTTTF